MIYKKLIQRKILSNKRKNPSLRYAQIAEQLEIEPPYLSRFLSGAKVNFSDELLFKLLCVLAMSPTEIERVILYRDLERTDMPERRKYLIERLKMLKIQSLKSEVNELKTELAQILNVIDSAMAG